MCVCVCARACVCEHVHYTCVPFKGLVAHTHAHLPRLAPPMPPSVPTTPAHTPAPPHALPIHALTRPCTRTSAHTHTHTCTHTLMPCAAEQQALYATLHTRTCMHPTHQWCSCAYTPLCMHQCATQELCNRLIACSGFTGAPGIYIFSGSSIDKVMHN